ncbi:MAG: hypothetical protein K2G77_06015 [Muribaculaceae bacterium]|nr:hypothetical protein [Muribaculaceae bacterium]
MDIKGICGAVLAYIVGIARVAGGIISISSGVSATETGVGAVLITVGLFICLSITMLLVKKSMFWFMMLALSVILFWLDGLVNGFLLYGSPRMSGQIINICCVMAILMLSYPIAKGNNEDV